MELRSIEAIFRALNGAGVKYLVVGGLAVNAHGYQRTTADLDLVIGLQPFDFESEFAAAVWQELESDLRVPIVRLPTLRALKLDAARLQDLADVEALDEIQRMRDCPEPHTGLTPGVF